MFGLFQSDLPIGKRLWLLLLALVIGGSLASTALAKVNESPLLFANDLLLLYGFGSLVESCVSGLVLFTVGAFVVGKQFTRYKTREEYFYTQTKNSIHWLGKLPLIISPIIFVIVVAKIAPSFENPALRKLGILGLLLFLIAELLVDVGKVTDKYYHEFLSIQLIGSDEIWGKLATSEEYKELHVKADWMKTLAFLCASDWEFVEYGDRSALLKRKRRMNLTGQFLALLSQRYIKQK